MISDEMNVKELFTQLDKTTSEFLNLASSFAEEEINVRPAENSWSAAQVADHVTRSNFSIVKALQLKGTPINRDPAERVEELKEVFLNFETKLKSPSFILPTQNSYEKNTLIARLQHSIEKIKELSEETDLSEMINHVAFGDITKLEILHFVTYHTLRHTRQLKNILESISK